MKVCKHTHGKSYLINNNVIFKVMNKVNLPVFSCKTLEYVVVAKTFQFGKGSQSFRTTSKKQECYYKPASFSWSCYFPGANICPYFEFYTMGTLFMIIFKNTAMYTLQ